jgi:hypothetical protein
MVSPERIFIFLKKGQIVWHMPFIIVLKVLGAKLDLQGSESVFSLIFDICGTNFR